MYNSERALTKVYLVSDIGAQGKDRAVSYGPLVYNEVYLAKDRDVRCLCASGEISRIR